MKLNSWILVLLLALATAAHAATNDLTGLLQKGLFEEEANRDLPAAIANYQSLANAFDKDRQLAATAIFRLGECYRKLGKTNEAALQYQRIIKEFSDQATLTTMSRQNLAGLNVAANSAAPDTRDSALIEEESNVATVQAQLDAIAKLPGDQARIYVQQNFPNPILTTLMQELDLAQQSLIKLKLDYTPDHPKYKNAQEMVDDLNAKVAAQVEVILQGLRGKLAESQRKLHLLQPRGNEIAGTGDGGPAGAAEPSTTAEEQQDIRRIQLMIQNSPDLINAPINGDGMTPLLLAATKGQLTVAKYLLDHGADVNGLSRNHGSTPLCAAAENGHKAMVELLLARGAEVSAGGLNPLYLAVSRGFPGVAQVLLANQADVNMVSGTDNTGMRPIHIAARDNKTELVKLLIDHGADVNVTDSTQIGYTPLELAASTDSTASAKLLLAAKAIVDAKDKSGNTPLHEAARAGNSEMVSLLLNARATVDPANNDDATPLLLAVAGGRVDATRILLQHKADPNHRGLIRHWQRNQNSNSNDRNWQPISFAVALNDQILKLLLDAGANPEGDSLGAQEKSPLFLAIDFNAPDAVQLLLEHGANPNRVENGYPALSLVIESGRDKRLIALLLDKSADPNARDKYGRPPLLLARDPEKMQMLIAHGADVNGSLRDGFTVLMEATYGMTNCLPLLLDRGAKIDSQETNGNTALHFGAFRSSPAAVAILLEHKANPNIQNKVGNTPLDLAKDGFDGSIPYSLMSPSSAGINPNTVSPETEHKIAEALVQAGGLANLPKRDRIEVRRGATAAHLSFSKDSPGRNQMSLLETIACSYDLLSRNSSGEWPKRETIRRTLFDNTFPFPDFKKIVIYRRTDNSAKQTAIQVDVEGILSSGDCSRDLSLQWGDVVEIPEADHPVDQTWPGLSETNANSLIKCVSRQVTIKIKGELATLTLAPELLPNSFGTATLRLTTASFMLRSVLDNSRLVRVSSDLSRVKVTRTDPATKKTIEWIVDCTEDNQSALWLRDGDMIEVPEK